MWGIRAHRLRWPAPVLCGLVILCAWQGLAHSLEIELVDVAPDRIERQRRAADGLLPLPGTPDLSRLHQRLSDKQLEPGSEVFIRIFKMESELELWMRRGDRFVLLDVYPICHWSGSLGPKLHEGDKQNPEGFYTIRRRQLHLVGRWPRALNVGFPNTYDRANGRTGSYILLHGGCSSVGCFAMTNAVMEEIFGLTAKALRAGQQEVSVHIFPFRMTEENLAIHASSVWIDFWRNLKEGYDAFEATHLPPNVGVCGKRYAVQEVEPGEVNVLPSMNGKRRARFASSRFNCGSVAGPESSRASRWAGETKDDSDIAVVRHISHKRPDQLSSPASRDGAEADAGAFAR